MNATKHAELSLKHWKIDGQKDFDFFYLLHDEMDRSKELESSNLHRSITHSIFWIKRVIIPVFGATYTAENGRVINLKDDLEKNHLLADFRNKFIPSLSDYISLCRDDAGDAMLFENFREENKELFENPEVAELLYSPLANTGKIKSLFVTHNSWFLSEILPRIFPNIEFKIKDWSISPSVFFNRMTWADWIDNGRKGYPPSFQKLRNKKGENVVFFDGSKLPPDFREFSSPVLLDS